MLSVNMTPKLLGFEIKGDYDELNRLYDAVWELVGTDYDDNPRLSMQDAIMRERLLALCYDLRHAYMGTRNVRMEENGMDRERAALLGISLPPLNNLYYSVEVLYPEAMYEIMVLGRILDERRAKLIKRASFHSVDANDPRVLFDQPCAMVVYYQSLVVQAVRERVSPNAFSRIRKQVAEGFSRVPEMYTQWIDVLNCKWCFLPEDKRKSKLGTFARDVSDFWSNQEYRGLKAGIDEYVRENGAVRANVGVADAVYPEEYDW